MNKRHVLLLAGLLTACSQTTSLPERSNVQKAGIGAPPSGRLLLIGQSSKNTYLDWQKVGQEASGGSVYYELKSAAFNQGNVNGTLTGIHQDFADFLASKGGKYLQVGISWKDNPPGYTSGDENLKASISRSVTQRLANSDAGLLAGFDNLINYMNSKPTTKFLLRLDYEVSPFYHCEDYQVTDTNQLQCNSYKGAFNAIASYIWNKSTPKNVGFIYHPVRGVYKQMYPGNTWVDWIGLSVFNHELCLPIYNEYMPDNGSSIINHTIYNGDAGISYDTTTKQCKNYVRNAQGGATPANFDLDPNVLGMLKFAKDSGKPMILSENAPMNFARGQNANGTESESDMTLWVNRLFKLVTYNGPLPEYMGVSGNVDLSNVVKAVVYMNTDLRYGWDGYYGQSFNVLDADNSQGGFKYDEDWYNNAQLDKYTTARTAFCNGLSSAGFTTLCGGTPPGGDTQAPSTPGALSSPSKTSTSINLSWGASTDNVAVTRYEIHVNNTLAASPTTTSTTLSGLTPNTAYTIKVRAVDAAGNTSPFNTPITVTTDNTTTPPPPSSGGIDIGDNYTYRIQSVQSNKCMDVSGISGANGAAIHLWDCIQQNPYYNQDWKFKRVSTPQGVFYQLIAQHSQKCLDVSGISLNNGAALHQWDCHSNPDDAGLRNQLFALQDMGGGSYRFRAKHSGKCIDIYGAGTANGTAFVQWDCHTGDNQKFRFQAVSH